MARFNPNTYDPAADSSPDTEGYREPDEGRELQGVILDRTQVEGDDGELFDACQCGCRSPLNPGRRFVQGHDARLKGILMRAHLAGVEVHVLQGGMLISTDAMDEAKDQGWAQFLKDAKARFDAKPAPKAKPEAGPMIEAKVGRWVRKGFVVDGEFRYTDAKGQAQRTSKFTPVG